MRGVSNLRSVPGGQRVRGRVGGTQVLQCKREFEERASSCCARCGILSIFVLTPIYTHRYAQVLQWKREFEETQVRAARVGVSASPPSGAAGISFSFLFPPSFFFSARPQRVAEQRRIWFSFLFSAGNCFFIFLLRALAQQDACCLLKLARVLICP